MPCREGDQVTITDRTDIQRALAELVEQAEKAGGAGAAAKLPSAIPHLRLQASKVADEVGLPPADAGDHAAWQAWWRSR